MLTTKPLCCSKQYEMSKQPHVEANGIFKTAAPQGQKHMISNNLYACLSEVNTNCCCDCNNVLQPSFVCSAVQTGALQIRQLPRFSGQLISGSVQIYCLHPKPHQNDTVKWFKAEKYDSDQKDEITEGERIQILRTSTQSSFLLIKDLNVEDRGAYFCQVNGTMGPGTEVQVASK